METTDRPVPEKERYTDRDFAELPEGTPYELIQGELVMSPSPSTMHQRVLRRLAWALQQHLEATGAGGEVFFAPMDVRLSEHDVVQPDLVYVRADRMEIVNVQRIDGAPDWVGEVLSPATAYRDLTTKKRLYEQHGVHEYWVVDPNERIVEIDVADDRQYRRHARIVHTGTAASSLLPGFEVAAETLFG